MHDHGCRNAADMIRMKDTQEGKEEKSQGAQKNERTDDRASKKMEGPNT